MPPLRRGWSFFGRLHGLHERARITRSKSIKEMLINFEVEHHLQPLARAAEIFHVGSGEYVRLSQDDGVSHSPAEKLAEGTKHLISLPGPLDLRPLLTYDKGDGIHSESRYAKLQPEAHNLEDFCLHVRIRSV